MVHSEAELNPNLNPIESADSKHHLLTHHPSRTTPHHTPQQVLTMRAPGPTLEDPEADISHVGEVTALVQSPDGKTVAVGYASGACVWSCMFLGWLVNRSGGLGFALTGGLTQSTN